MLRLFIFLTLFFVALPTANAEFLSLKRAYYKLRKSDPEVSRLLRWEDLGAALRQDLENNRQAKYAPEAHLILARLSERIYRYHSQKAYLTQAIFYYERLARDYRGSRFVDDGLLSLGDLRRHVLRDEIAARSAYFEIVDIYPKGDQVAKAKKRLGGLLSERPQRPPEVVKPALVEKPVEAPNNAAKAVEPEEEKTASGEQPQLARNKAPLIVIDPGHGGENLGAVGVEGINEKEIVLNISIYLDEFLRERLGVRTMLTRARDVDLELQERIKMANDQNADLFISVHANASQYKTARGVETYYLDNTNDKSSLKLANRENLSPGQQLGDLDFILSDLIQNAKLDESITLAHDLQDVLWSTLNKYYDNVKNLGVKKAPFYVLVGAHMPCVLVEVSFLDHPVEGRRLITRRYQKLVAQALYEGVKKYLER